MEFNFESFQMLLKIDFLHLSVLVNENNNNKYKTDECRFQTWKFSAFPRISAFFPILEFFPRFFMQFFFIFIFLFLFIF